MFTLRNDQLEALNASIAKDFERRMVKHLAHVFPEHSESLSEDAALRLIRVGIRKASTYHITSERDVALFIDLMVGIAPDFDQQPDMIWGRKILEEKALTPGDKMDLIFSRLKNRSKNKDTASENGEIEP